MIKILYIRGKNSDTLKTPELLHSNIKNYEARLNYLLEPYTVEVPFLCGSACSNIWMPILETLDLESYDVIIGQSSGVHAVLRLAEKRKLKNLILTSATDQHRNNRSQLRTGWFDKPWDYKKIISNTRKIIICNGGKDPFISKEEGLKLSKNINCKMYLMEQFGHSDWYHPHLNVPGGELQKNPILKSVVQEILE